MKFLSKTRIFSICFYVIAALFLVYTLFLVVNTIQYLAEVQQSGMYTGVTFDQVLLYFMGQVGPYLFYTLVLFFCGYAIDLISGTIVPEGQKVEHGYFDKEAKVQKVASSESEGTLTNEPADEVATDFAAFDEEYGNGPDAEKIEETVAKALTNNYDTQEIDSVEQKNEE